MKTIPIREATKVEITSLVDNYCDLFLADTDQVKRLRVLPPRAPKAEPGLAFLIKVYTGSEEHSILFDGGISGECLLHNLQMLAASKAVMLGEIGVDAKNLEAVVLSHGHFDHFAGLPALLSNHPQPLPLVLHPGAFVPRRFRQGPEMVIELPGPDPAALAAWGTSLRTTAGPSTLASDLILVSGEVERSTGFEKGLPGMEAKIDDQWVPDPFLDDQGLAVNVKNKGLVVIGGCSHAGIVNTVRHLRKISGVQQIHAVLGGFHLTGDNEEIITPTIEALKELHPDHIVPMHCTGWKAIQRFAQHMPDQFMLNSVGSTYVFS